MPPPSGGGKNSPTDGCSREGFVIRLSTGVFLRAFRAHDLPKLKKHPTYFDVHGKEKEANHSARLAGYNFFPT
jgi:hypothetical protein